MRTEHEQGSIRNPPRPMFTTVAAALGLLIPLLLGLLLAWHTLSDFDIWLHGRAGQDILSGDGIPRSNGYSFTAPDHEWIDHEWLFQVLVALVASGRDGAEKAAPWNALRFGLVAVLLLVLLLGEGRTRAGPQPGWSNRPIALALPAIVSLALIWPRLILRPELLAFLGFVLAVRWIDRAAAVWSSEGGRPLNWRDFLSPRRPAGRTFWLAVVWAQFHGTYILVGLLWLLATVLAPLQRRWLRPDAAPAESAAGPVRSSAALSSHAGLWLGAAVLAFMAGLLTPNGISGLLYPFRAIGQLGQEGMDLRQTISEMAPLLSLRGALGTTVLVFKLSLIWSVVWIVASAGRISLLRIAVLILAAVAALYSQRQMGYYALSFFLLHSSYRADRPVWMRRLLQRRRLRAVQNQWAHVATTLSWLGLLVAASIGAIWTGSLLTDRFYLAEGVARRFGTGPTPAHYPFEVVAQLRQPGREPLRLANNIDCAAVLIHQRAGLVFIDGRTEAYPPAAWRQYRRFKQGGAPALELLRRHRAQAVVLAHRGSAVRPLIETLLASSDWQAIAADEAGIGFTPADVSTRDPAGVTAATLGAAAEKLLSLLPPPSGQELQKVGSTAAADRCLALASLLRLAKMTEPAERLYRRGLLYRTDHPILNHNFGNLLMDQHRFGEALAHFQRALAANGRMVESRVNAGICHFQLEDLPAAERAFRTAVRQDKNRAEAWVNLAEVRRRRGDRAGALQAYERALRLLPSDARLRQRVAAYRSES